MIDFGGPWEVFSNVHLYGDKVAPDQMHPFHLYTVAAKVQRNKLGLAGNRV